MGVEGRCTGRGCLFCQRTGLPEKEKGNNEKRKFRGQEPLVLAMCLLLGLLLYTSSDNLVRIWGMYQEIRSWKNSLRKWRRKMNAWQKWSG